MIYDFICERRLHLDMWGKQMKWEVWSTWLLSRSAWSMFLMSSLIHSSTSNLRAPEEHLPQLGGFIHEILIPYLKGVLIGQFTIASKYLWSFFGKFPEVHLLRVHRMKSFTQQKLTVTAVEENFYWQERCFLNADAVNRAVAPSYELPWLDLRDPREWLGV